MKTYVALALLTLTSLLVACTSALGTPAVAPRETPVSSVALRPAEPNTVASDPRVRLPTAASPGLTPGPDHTDHVLHAVRPRPTASVSSPTLAPLVVGQSSEAAAIMPPTPTPLSVTMRQQIFQEVWSIIDTHYLYPDFGGVDWLAVRSEFEPLIAAAATDEAFYQLINTMVNRLDDNHSRFLPPQAAEQQDVLSSGREEQVGIGVTYRDLGDGLLLQHVFPDSPAERAGLLPRDRIVAINGAFYRMASLQGPEGSEVRLTVVRPGEPSRDIVLVRARTEGRITPVTHRLAGDIGYLGITTLWVADTDAQVQAALTALTASRPLQGLILDLRSNPGGWRSVMTGILSHFTTGEVGIFTSRQGNTVLHIAEPGSPDLRGIPLIVLVDGATASYAELIAAILQSQAGALVLGTSTAGNTETIYSYELTGGARLWVAQEGFVLPDSSDLEGVGVQPEISLVADWTRFSETDDPGITTALRLLAPQAGGE